MSRQAARGELARFADFAGALQGAAIAWLHWTPDQFWDATPAELDSAAALLLGGGEQGGEALSRATIDALKEQFPDG